jgi:hypothetical protein
MPLEYRPLRSQKHRVKIASKVRRRKGDLEKVRIARRLRAETTATLKY